MNLGAFWGAGEENLGNSEPLHSGGRRWDQARPFQGRAVPGAAPLLTLPHTFLIQPESSRIVTRFVLLGLRPPRDKLEGELTNPTHHPRNTHRTFKKPTIIAFCGPGPSNIQPCLHLLLFNFRRPSEMLPLFHLVAPEHQKTQPPSI